MDPHKTTGTLSQPPLAEPAAPKSAGSPPAAGERDDGRATVRALARGLAILSLFDAEHRDLALDDIVARTGIARMTAYRLARTLHAHGYLAHHRATGRYSLGPAMLSGIYLAEDYSRLVAAARPYLEDLAAETGESVTLAVRVGGHAVCADLVRSRRPGRLEIAVGRMVDDASTAHGKLFIALTARSGLEPGLVRVRRDDLAYDLEEHTLGTCAVAAPVRDQVGVLVATVAVVVPAGRFGADARHVCTDAVRRTAQALSAYLGYARGQSA